MNNQLVYLLSLMLLASSVVSAVPLASVECGFLLERTTEVPLSSFVVDIFRAGDIHALVDNLENKYEATSFRIPMGRLFAQRTIFILQDRDLVKTVMRKDSKLPFVNRNFDLSHGHFNSINSVNTHDPLWSDLHAGLEGIFKHKDILPIMEKYKSVLTGSLNYNLNKTLEEYYLKVWSEYCFGPIDYDQFKDLRDRLVDVLAKSFHQNRFNRLPVLGRVTSTINRFRYATELKKVDEDLGAILRSSIENKQGAFYELFVQLSKKYDNAFQITLDNSFLAILVYDFIHIVMLDTLAHIAKHPEVDRGEQFKSSRHEAFLYPFRFRIIEEDYDGFKKGDFVILNLQKTKLYFSAGLRFCPGAGLFGEIAQKTLEIFSDYDLRFVDFDQQIVRSENRDLPFMQSEHNVTLLRCPFSEGGKKDE